MCMHHPPSYLNILDPGMMNFAFIECLCFTWEGFMIKAPGSTSASARCHRKPFFSTNSEITRSLIFRLSCRLSCPKLKRLCPAWSRGVRSWQQGCGCCRLIAEKSRVLNSSSCSTQVSEQTPLFLCLWLQQNKGHQYGLQLYFVRFVRLK